MISSRTGADRTKVTILSGAQRLIVVEISSDLETWREHARFDRPEPALELELRIEASHAFIRAVRE